MTSAVDMDASGSFYATSLGLLSLVAVTMAGFQARAGATATANEHGAHLLTAPHTHGSSSADEGAGVHITGDDVQRVKVRLFKANYLLVFALVMGADWLQGPYIFSLYHDEYKLSMHTIAILFVLGFLAAGISAPFVGRWADRSGRRKLCIVFTFLYTFSALTKLHNSLPWLCVGRVLGGFSTSLLFTTFESWLVSSSSDLLSPSELSTLLGRCTLVNSIVAASSGVVADYVVHRTNTYTSPFIVSAVLLLTAGWIVTLTWGENYGGGMDISVSAGIASAMSELRQSPALIAVLAAQTAFEGSMYLFVFLWVPVLQEAARLDSATAPLLPLGTIFSAFMVAMSLGSLWYNDMLRRNTFRLASILLPSFSPSPRIMTLPELSVESVSTSSTSPYTDEANSPVLFPPPESLGYVPPSSTSREVAKQAPLYFDTPQLAFHASLLLFTLILSAASLALAAMVSSAPMRFSAFVVFEMCCGLYFPIVGTLRSALFPEDTRATLAAIFRVPFNLLVTLALVSGLEEKHSLVAQLSCASLLLSAAVLLWTIKKGERAIEGQGQIRRA